MKRREEFGGIWQIPPNFAGVFPAYKKGQHDFLTMFRILPVAERLECEAVGQQTEILESPPQQQIWWPEQGKY